MIRLLKRLPSGELTLVPFDDDDPPPYAILSHTWFEGQEVTYSELVSGTSKDKTGYAKIEFCVDRAAADEVQYAWMDTCCIDKSDPVELSTAINSMFRWYQRAVKCYVLLSDVHVPAEVTDPQACRITWEGPFRQSRWFKRGWTLQELLAPPIIEFFSYGSKLLGSKIQLEQEIHEVTRIPVAALRAHGLSSFSVKERMSWVAERATTVKEDKVYCLFGIFEVFLPLIYGEGEVYAKKRLREEIQKRHEGRGTTSLQDLKFPSPLPFPKNELFVGRASQLLSLDKFLHFSGHRRTAIYGLGGCGKSALATEFAYRALASGRLVLWVPALSRESFEEAYREIGTRLRLPGISDDNANIKKLVQDRLSSDDMGSWLMVVDNADYPAVLLEDDGGQGPGRLYNFIPYSKKGKVIFTTRSMKVAEDLTPGNTIELSDMSTSKDDAQQLFERRISQPALIADKTTIMELLEILTFLPLAIVQAAAFINKNRTPVSRYISLFRETSAEKELFGKHFEDSSRYQEMDRTIARTWQISFNQIRKQDVLAAEYLSFMACVDRISIPESLLPIGKSTVQHVEALGTLEAYAFITERQQLELEAERCFDMHRLVHLALAWWLEGHGEQAVWTDRATARLEELIPYGGHKGEDLWTAYLTHAMHIARSVGKLDDRTRASLLDRVGRCQASLGQYSSAEMTHRQMLELRKKTLGKEHPQTLTSMNELGLALDNQGKYREAETMHERALTVKKRVLGMEHPNTLTSMANLASTYSNQGRWKEAEELEVQVVETSKRVLGAEHQDTLTSIANLASTYRNQVQWQEAEQLEVPVLETRKRVLGSEHPDTLASMNNLAFTWKAQGKLENASKLMNECVQLQVQVLGAVHPDTLSSSVTLLEWGVRKT